MGAFYIEEISDYEEEDTNNNYLLDPDAINLEEHNIHLEDIKMKRENGQTQWKELIDESSRRYDQTTTQKKPEAKEKIIIKEENGEEQAGTSRSFEDGMFATMPGAKNHVTAETAGRPSILRALLERDSRSNSHSRMINKKALDLKNKEEINKEKKKDQSQHTEWRKTLNSQINEIKIENTYTNQKKWKNIMTMIHNHDGTT